MVITGRAWENIWYKIGAQREGHGLAAEKQINRRMKETSKGIIIRKQ